MFVYGNILSNTELKRVVGGQSFAEILSGLDNAKDNIEAAYKDVSQYHDYKAKYETALTKLDAFINSVKDHLK